MSLVVNINDRMVLSAIVDRLIYANTETFSSEDAIELRRILPQPKKSLWSSISRYLPTIAASGRISGMINAGFSPGVGNIKVKGNDYTFDLDSEGKSVVRAGQWKLYNFGDSIEIEQVMADGGDEGRSACIEYEDKEPTKMLLLCVKNIHFWFLCFAVSEFKPWKLPV